MAGGTAHHGYGGHRAESFARYYRRSILGEGCGCAERVLDSASPSRGTGLLAAAAAWLVRFVWRRAGTGAWKR